MSEPLGASLQPVPHTPETDRPAPGQVPAPVTPEHDRPMGRPMLDQELGTWAGQKESLGFWSAVGSLSVSMMGTGIVAFPYAFSLCGFVAGALALLGFGVLSHLSYVTLMRCTSKLHQVNYTELVEQAGSLWQKYVTFALWLMLVMAVSSYVLISADLIRSVAMEDMTLQPPLLLSNAVLFALILAIMFPLCLTTSLSGVSLATTYCACSMFAVVAIIIGRCVDISINSPPTAESAPQLGTTASSVVLSLPILGCAMFGHMNIGQIYGEMLPSVKPKASMMIMTSCALVVAVYLCVGCFGYAAFGSETLPDVVAQLASFDRGWPITTCQILLASFIVLKTPLLLFPLRTISLSILKSCTAENERDGRSFDISLMSRGRNACLTLTLLVCVYVAAVALPNLDTLLEVLGAIIVVPLCFIVPARMAWVIQTPRPTLLCATLGLVGVLVSVLSLADVIAGFF